MTGPWAVRLAWSDSTGLSPLRCLPGLEVHCDDQAVWLRGAEADDDLLRSLRSLPGARRFAVLPDGQLVPAGNRVPNGHLPEGEWVALSEWIQLSLQRSAFAGQAAGKVGLEVVRSTRPASANVLLTSLETWSDYGSVAPGVRLEPLTFAVDHESRVVVWGTPVPPVSGTRFAERAGIAVAAGWTWSPPVDPEVVGELLGLQQGDLALLYPDGSWDHIRADDFVRTTRSAIRFSAEVRTA